MEAWDGTLTGAGPMMARPTGEPFTEEDLRRDLVKLGLRPGMTVMVHSAFRSLGPVKGGPAALIAALISATDPGGTLIFPTFTFQFCEDPTYIFDPSTSTSEMGALTNVARAWPGALRTDHPIYSVTAIGARALTVAQLRHSTAYGPDSPFGWMLRVGGQVLILGLPYTQSWTLIHAIEEGSNWCSYRYPKLFSGRRRRGGHIEPVVASMLVRDRASGVITAVDPAGERLEAMGLVTVGSVGKATAKLMAPASTIAQAVHAIVATHGAEGLLYRREVSRSTPPVIEQWQATIRDLWPRCRSLMGPGFRASAARLLEGLAYPVFRAETGEALFDWTVPDEWWPRVGRLSDSSGRVYADFDEHNLSLVSHSEPIHTWLDYKNLQAHLHSDPDRPDVIPYRTSYYSRTWGFALPDRVRQTMPPNEHYHVEIDASLGPGTLEAYEVVIPGEVPDNVLWTTYLCHPSMAVNELSGPLVWRALIDWLRQRPRKPHFTHRFVLAPETLGTLLYLRRQALAPVVAGYVLTCLGHEKGEVIVKLPWQTNSLTERVAVAATLRRGRKIRLLDWDPTRGSDERQYNAVEPRWPIGALMSVVPGEYPEYHSSADTPSLFGDLTGLYGMLGLCQDMVEILDVATWKPYVQPEACGEPQLGRRGLYGSGPGGGAANADRVALRLWVLNLSDGHTSILDMAERTGYAPALLADVARECVEAGLLGQ